MPVDTNDASAVSRKATSGKVQHQVIAAAAESRRAQTRTPVARPRPSTAPAMTARLTLPAQDCRPRTTGRAQPPLTVRPPSSTSRCCCCLSDAVARHAASTRQAHRATVGTPQTPLPSALACCPSQLALLAGLPSNLQRHPILFSCPRPTGSSLPSSLAPPAPPPLPLPAAQHVDPRYPHAGRAIAPRLGLQPHPSLARQHGLLVAVPPRQARHPLAALGNPRALREGRADRPPSVRPHPSSVARQRVLDDRPARTRVPVAPPACSRAVPRHGVRPARPAGCDVGPAVLGERRRRLGQPVRPRRLALRDRHLLRRNRSCPVASRRPRRRRPVRGGRRPRQGRISRRRLRPAHTAAHPAALDRAGILTSARRRRLPFRPAARTGGPRLAGATGRLLPSIPYRSPPALLSPTVFPLALETVIHPWSTSYPLPSSPASHSSSPSNTASPPALVQPFRCKADEPVVASAPSSPKRPKLRRGSRVRAANRFIARPPTPPSRPARSKKRSTCVACSRWARKVRPLPAASTLCAPSGAPTFLSFASATPRPPTVRRAALASRTRPRASRLHALRSVRAPVRDPASSGAVEARRG